MRRPRCPHPRRASASPSGRRTSTSTISVVAPQRRGGVGPIAGEHANLVALRDQRGHQAAAEQPGAPGHGDHTGSPLAEPRFSISRVGIDSSAGSSKPSTWE